MIINFYTIWRKVWKLWKYWSIIPWPFAGQKIKALLIKKLCWTEQKKGFWQIFRTILMRSCLKQSCPYTEIIIHAILLQILKEQTRENFYVVLGLLCLFFSPVTSLNLLRLFPKWESWRTNHLKGARLNRTSKHRQGKSKAYPDMDIVFTVKWENTAGIFHEFCMSVREGMLDKKSAINLRPESSLALEKAGCLRDLRKW